MKVATRISAVCLLLAFASAAGAAPTPQQLCNSLRIAAWGKYEACIAKMMAREQKGVYVDNIAAAAKCRYALGKKWTMFQLKPSLAGTTCIGSRFVASDSGTTVTDQLTQLVWEKHTDDDGPLDKDNVYQWSFSNDVENGNAFTVHLQALNFFGFGNVASWRLPTVAELLSINIDFPCTGESLGPTCTCPASPCIPPEFGPTEADDYWTATSYPQPSAVAWAANFHFASAGNAGGKTSNFHVRAVHGGW